MSSYSASLRVCIRISIKNNVKVSLGWHFIHSTQKRWITLQIEALEHDDHCNLQIRLLSFPTNSLGRVSRIGKAGLHAGNHSGNHSGPHRPHKPHHWFGNYSGNHSGPHRPHKPHHWFGNYSGNHSGPHRPHKPHHWFGNHSGNHSGPHRPHKPHHWFGNKTGGRGPIRRPLRPPRPARPLNNTQIATILANIGTAPYPRRKLNAKIFIFLTTRVFLLSLFSGGPEEPLQQQHRWPYVSKKKDLSNPFRWLFFLSEFLTECFSYFFAVLSRGDRPLFGPTRKSSPWGNFSGSGLNQSIKRRLSLQTSRLIDWFTMSQLWLDWFIGFVPHDLFLRGAGLKPLGQYSTFHVPFHQAQITMFCVLSAFSLHSERGRYQWVGVMCSQQKTIFRGYLNMNRYQNG